MGADIQFALAAPPDVRAQLALLAGAQMQVAQLQEISALRSASTHHSDKFASYPDALGVLRRASSGNSVQTAQNLNFP